MNFQAQQRVMDMREQLTESDIKKIREEIEYRKLVVRKEAIEAVKTPGWYRTSPGRMKSA